VTGFPKLKKSAKNRRRPDGKTGTTKKRASMGRFPEVWGGREMVAGKGATRGGLKAPTSWCAEEKSSTQKIM